MRGSTPNFGPATGRELVSSPLKHHCCAPFTPGSLLRGCCFHTESQPSPRPVTSPSPSAFPTPVAPFLSPPFAPLTNPLFPTHLTPQQSLPQHHHSRSFILFLLHLCGCGGFCFFSIALQPSFPYFWSSRDHGPHNRWPSCLPIGPLVRFSRFHHHVHSRFNRSILRREHFTSSNRGLVELPTLSFRAASFDDDLFPGCATSVTSICRSYP